LQGPFQADGLQGRYEVAQLYSDGEFAKALQGSLTAIRLKVLLAPPLLASRDKVTGHLRKRGFSRWCSGVGLLARQEMLRGTSFDIFGYTTERRTERALPGEYTAMIVARRPSLDLPQAGRARRTPELVRSWPVKSQCRALQPECTDLRPPSPGRSRRRRSRGAFGIFNERPWAVSLTEQ
jgi:indolepyruvate ferredoxin oxidoreductase